MPNPRVRAAILALALSLLAILVVAGLSVAAGGFVVPQCALCHRSQTFTAATSATVHSGIKCSACHSDSNATLQASTAFQQAGHVTRFVLNGASDGLGRVPDRRCVVCHETIYTKVVAVKGLKINHAECAKGKQCTDCHSTVAHGPASGWARTYSMEMCLHCHGPEPSLSKCNECHDQKTLKGRLASGPWAITHGASWRETHGMGDMFTCAACHAKGYCAKCHGPGVPHTPDFRTQHPGYATSKGAQCTTCHKQTFCTGCHGGVVLPHPKKFTMTHPALIKKNGQAMCMKCHNTEDCTQCHEMHIHPGGAVKITGGSPSGGAGNTTGTQAAPGQWMPHPTPTTPSPNQPATPSNPATRSPGQ